MFEDLADPIVTGREELGVSKLFSDIDISCNGGSITAKLSWRGAEWAEFEWKNLQKDGKDASMLLVKEKSGEGEGLLVHKYIPGTGSEELDADYDVLLLKDAEESSIQSIHTARPGDVRFQINELDWKQLPTLHSVVSRIAELPVFEILEGSVTKAQGVSDFSKVQRLT